MLKKMLKERKNLKTLSKEIDEKPFSNKKKCFMETQNLPRPNIIERNVKLENNKSFKISVEKLSR